MTGKTARQPPPAPADERHRALETRVQALQAEVAQKDLLVTQGFQAFTESAEKMQEAYKRLHRQVGVLTREVEKKNRELERNLTEKENVKKYLSNIFESLAIGVFVTDLAGGVTSVNRAGLAMLEAPAEKLVGRSVNEVLGASLVPTGGSAGDAPLPPADLEEPILFDRKDGEPLRLQVSLSPMTEESGNPVGFILNVQDVTLLKKLEEHAERRNRFTAMGEMAANMAHEIRNPLGSIELFTSLLKKGLPQDEERLELTGHISSAIGSMNHLISNLLEYTKPRPAALQKVNLHQLLQEVVAFTSFRAEHSQVELTTSFKAKRCAIRGDGELLKQVFYNLFLNALQAMADGGTLAVATRQRTITNAALLARIGDSPLPAPGHREVLELSVRDNGTGMTREIRKQIFDPFFTTKDRGTGLGLAIVHTIVEAHHALIDVQSRQNRGTTFTMMFPLVEP